MFVSLGIERNPNTHWNHNGGSGWTSDQRLWEQIGRGSKTDEGRLRIPDQKHSWGNRISVAAQGRNTSLCQIVMIDVNIYVFLFDEQTVGNCILKWLSISVGRAEEFSRKEWRHVSRFQRRVENGKKACWWNEFRVVQTQSTGTRDSVSFRFYSWFWILVFTFER